MLSLYKRRASTRLANKFKNQKILSEIEEEPTTMTNPKDIFNNLRIPDVIKDLQTFDGNTKLLPDFIKNAEEILLCIRNTDNTPYGQILLRAIRNKVVGPANEALNSYLTPLVWDEIKQTLLDLYTDKRDESTLIRELHNIKQRNKSVEDFHSEIIDIQYTLLNNVRIKENNQSIKNSKKTLFQEMCLDVFLTGLDDPVGATVRAMRPKDLQTALTYCQKEISIKSNNKNTNYYPKQHFVQNTNPVSKVVRFQRPTTSFNRPYNQQYRSYSSEDQINTPPRQYNNFRQLPQIKDSNSGNTRRSVIPPRSGQSHSNRTQNFKIEEVNNINNVEEHQPEETTNIDDNQNFRPRASRNQWDT